MRPRIPVPSPGRTAFGALFALALSPILTLVPTLVRAEDPVLLLELSAAQEGDNACLLSFVAENRHEAAIAALTVEAVLFDAAGQVAQLTLLDLADLPPGRPRVRQFQFPGAGCAAISRVLVNGVARCDGEGLAPQTCAAGLRLTSRTAIELLG